MKRVLRPRKPCTRAELERIVAMRDQGLPWSVISVRLGRDINCLKVTTSRFRNGQWGDGIEQRQIRDAAIERFIAETGCVSAPAIAAAFGLSVGGMRHALARLGLDREMRDELAGPSRRAAYMPARTPDPIIASMRQRAREGATVSVIMAEFDISRPTVCLYTKGINSDRRRRASEGSPVKVRRVRTVTLSRSSIPPVCVGEEEQNSLGASLTGPGCPPSELTPSDFAPAGIHPSRNATLSTDRSTSGPQ